ncbi:hypothetical protein F4803DRAFT_534503 [Xylaria telfairii]|nr:hypothetical protein F4803DRAFT_534503 [Xylaria telfairii]
MEHYDDPFFKTVFRLRGLPHSVKTPDDVASLVSKSLGDIPARDVRVFSVTTNLGFGDNSLSKVATLMFATIPSVVRGKNNTKEWEICIQTPKPGHSLVLDTHFEGMTPMNDMDHLSHRFDCIAISGLGSHPFGSWQPKDSDKTYMWIRDALPKNIHGVRAVLYGYETRLVQSQSFELIKDLANKLIALLTTYGWGSRSSKPIIFLAHSLGGLVIRDALRQLLSDGSNEEYRVLLNTFRGALFFGVPNLGMEQDSFRTIVQGNPNENLIDDIGRGSQYLRRLNEYFSSNPINAQFKQFWAYETLESSTVVITSGGDINRNGPRAILVSRESATLRLIEKNPPVTFPIKATHSDMVKFTRESPDYHIVVSKISSIVNNELSHDSQSYNHQSSISYQAAKNGTDPAGSYDIVKENMTAELHDFRRVSGLTAAEEAQFQSSTFETTQAIISNIQSRQEKGEGLMYMQRLEPVLVSMKQFAEVSEAIGVTYGSSDAMIYVWGPMEYILLATSLYSDVFNCILDAYQGIGEQIPKLQVYRERLASNTHLKHVLVLIYSDILWFHGEILRQIKQREWKTMFISTWGDFATCLDQIKANIGRSDRLISSNVSFKELEEMQNLRASSLHTFKTNKTAEDISRRATIMQWLSPYDCEAEQARHRKTRSVCKSPGQWLLNNSLFQKWSASEVCSDPFIWLSGIPGAGKTILASVIVDHLQLEFSGTAVAYFYCKHGNESRNSFISIARAILAQLLCHRPHLTPYYFEKASTSGDFLLKSESTAKGMIQTLLSSCDKTYIVIDGVDECGRNDRNEIAEVFRTTIEDLPAGIAGSVRCMFISQDDDNARRNFRDIPAIKISHENQDDLKEFAEKRHRALEAKFGLLRSNDCHISNILVARARGMFIFADLFAKYLEAQLSKAALLAELDPSKLPVSLDHLYERILTRVFETRDNTSVTLSIRQVLGWIACARRPLKWAEVQGAVCVDFDNQIVDRERMLSDSPKDLFASLIEIREDNTVELVHETARAYLCKHIIDFHGAHYSLAIVSIGYLTLPQLDEDAGESVYTNLVNGTYSFYDYASACWAMHLQEAVSALKPDTELTQLLESLETFIDVHWSPKHKPLQDLKKVTSSLESISTSKTFDKIVHAVGWAKRQSSKHGQGPSPDEALDLWEVTERVRSILEDAHPSREEEEKLRGFYGPCWFKCPRVNCLRYYEGFGTFEQRQHHLNKHDRPFLCYVAGCHMEVFGYATGNELKQHLLKYHGIGSFDDMSDGEFPDPPKRKAVTAAKSEAKYKCTECGKDFTRNHNLKNHLRSHKGLKPYECKVCNEKFTRKSDCDRHERGHGEKMFICVGSLKDGSPWGCNKAFVRLDKLVAHFRSRIGQRCIKPHLQEKMQETNGNGAKDAKLFDDQTGENADALRAAGKSLPRFQEFLQLCGLISSDAEPEAEA